ncbi:MAG: hypothetical protein JOZ86_14645 [Candidatus Eremiobacteraeota bacterium]|nr:hypothetical protein [Candidatus Eremiobacteraeota bacterium]
MIGVECEYGVFDGDSQIDVATIIGDVVSASVVPAHAESATRFWLPDGQLFMADGVYAELATPPEPAVHDVPSRLAQAVFRNQNWFLGALERYSAKAGRTLTVRGCSTHLNIATAESPTITRRLARAFGPLFCFTMAVPSTLSLLFRPRPGRLEIAGHHIPDPALLRANITLLIGAAAAARSELLDVPRLSEDALDAAQVRYGWRLTLEAASPQLRARGRSATLVDSAGQQHLAQDYFAAAWQAIAPYLRDVVAPTEIRHARQYVCGNRTTALEKRVAPARLARTRVHAATLLGARTFANALRTRQVAGRHWRPYFVDWRFIVVRAASAATTRYVTIPYAAFGAWASGELDDEVARQLDAAPLWTLRTLRDTDTVAAFQHVDRASLAAQLERVDGGKKKPRKPPPKKKPCSVVTDAAGEIWIYVPTTLDPERIRSGTQEPPQSATLVASGVFAHDQTFVNGHVDHHVASLGFDFAFRRNYRSRIDYDGVLGLGWDHDYNVRIVPKQPPNAVPIPGGWGEHYSPNTASGGLTYYHGTGRLTQHAFASWQPLQIQWSDGSFDAIVSTYTQNPGEEFEIQRYAVLGGTVPDAVKGESVFYRIRGRGGLRILLNCHGHIVERRDRNRNSMRFSYGEPVNPSTLYSTLQSIQDTVGRGYSITYRKDIGKVPRIDRITETAALSGRPKRSWTYQYNAATSELTGVALVAGNAGTPNLSYRYQRGRPGLLTEIVNPTESVNPILQRSYLQNTYAGDRVTAQRVGDPTFGVPESGAGGTYTIVRTGNDVVVTDRAGHDWTYVLRSWGDTEVVSDVKVRDEIYDGGLGIMPADLVTHYDYDQNYHVSDIRHPSGRKEHFGYRNANAQVTEGDEYDSVTPKYAHANDLARDDLVSYELHPAGGDAPLVTSYVYEHLFNQATTETGPQGTTTYGYLTPPSSRTPEYNGNPISIQRPPQELPDGSSVPVDEQYSYGVGGAVNSHTDADGKFHYYKLYASGPLRGLISAHSVGTLTAEAFEYDLFRRVTKRTDARGNAWQNEYDARDNLAAGKDPLWQQSPDPAPHCESCTYDLNDRLQTRTITIVDDPNPGLTGLTPAGTMTMKETTQYDVLGLKVSFEQDGRSASPTGRDEFRTWQWRYDPEERVALATTPRAYAGERPDARTRYAYNARGLTTVTTQGDGDPAMAVALNPSTMRTAYDEDGRPAMRVNDFAQAYVTRYDPYGRIAAEEGPDGTIVHREYRSDRPVLKREWVEGPISVAPVVIAGAADVILQHADVTTGAILREAELLVDRSYRIIRRAEKVFDPRKRAGIADTNVDAPDLVSETWYSKGGRVSMLVDPAKRQTSYSYDDAGRNDTVTLPGNHTVAHTFDGFLEHTVTTTFVPDDGSYVVPPLLGPRQPIVVAETITYDRLERRIRVESQNTVTTFAYNSVGSLRAQESALGRRVYEYDPASRRINETITNVRPGTPETLRLRYDYDHNDNRVALFDGELRQTTATYDGRNLLIHYAQPRLPAIELERRSDGLIGKATRGTRTATYTYTETGKPATIVYADAGVSTAQIYAYDGLGNLTWTLDANNHSPDYPVHVLRKHDSIGRLVQEGAIIDNIAAGVGDIRHTIDYEYTAGSGFEETTITRHGETFVYHVGPDNNLKSIVSSIGGTHSVFERLHQGPNRKIQTTHVLDRRGQRLELVDTQIYDSVGRVSRNAFWIRDALFVPHPASANDQLLPIAQGEDLHYGPHGMMDVRSVPMILRPEEAPVVLNIDPAPDPFALVFGYYRPSVTATTHIPLHPPAAITFQYAYDGAGRLLSETEQRGAEKREIIRSWDGANRPSFTSMKATSLNPNDGSLISAVDVWQYKYPDPWDTPPWVRKDGGPPGGDAVWTFDASWRLTSAVTRVHRTFEYDALDRLIHARVAEAGQGHRYYYDGLGRLVARVHDMVTNGHACDVYLFDGDTCVAEYRNDETQARRCYLFDDRGHLVDCVNEGRQLIPLTTFDGSVLAVFNRTTTQNPPFSPAPSILERLNFYFYGLRLLQETHSLSQFDAESTYFDYSSGDPQVKPLRDSLITIGTNGSRWFALEQLQVSGGRFFDSTLGAAIAPDTQGSWADPHALANPSAGVAAYNSIALEATPLDGGEVAWSATKTAVIGIGSVVAAGAAIALAPIAGPLLLVGSVVLLASGAYAAYANRTLHAIETGANTSLGSILLASGGDAVGLSGLVEGYTGRDLVTGAILASEDRSARLGTSIGAAVTVVAGKPATRLGARMADTLSRSVSAWWAMRAAIHVKLNVPGLVELTREEAEGIVGAAGRPSSRTAMLDVIRQLLRTKPERVFAAKYDVNMWEAPESSPLNAVGIERNAKWFWRELLRDHPELFSKTNKALIKKGLSPVVDGQWCKHFEWHRYFMDETIHHHHIEHGPMATPLPAGAHQMFYLELHPLMRPLEDVAAGRWPKS